MALRIKHRIAIAKDAIQLPFDTIWFGLGAAAVITVTLVITGIMFLKNHKNPFYNTQNKPVEGDNAKNFDEGNQSVLEDPSVDSPDSMRAHSTSRLL